MSEHIELTTSEYRRIPDGPLGRPRQLWTLAIGCLIVSCISAWGGWLLGGPFAALLPIPSAIIAGVAIAGLFPRYWFKPDESN